MATKKNKKTEVKEEKVVEEVKTSEMDAQAETEIEKKDEVIEDDSGQEKKVVPETNNETMKTVDVDQLEEGGGSGGIVKVLITTMLVILAVAGWALYIRELFLKQEVVSVEEVETVVEATPTPTPTVVQLSRSDISLEILNGSGVSGLAGTTAEAFEDLGYVDVEIGNADEIEESVLYVKEGLEEQVEVLLSDVEEELGITKISGELEDSEYDAQIVLGSE